MKPIIEYAGVIWNNNETQFEKYIEKLQHIMTRNALAVPRFPYSPIYKTYQERMDDLNIISLKRRFTLQAILYGVRISINTHIMKRRTSRRIRRRNIFNVTRIARNTTILYRIMNDMNDYALNINLNDR